MVADGPERTDARGRRRREPLRAERRPSRRSVARHHAGTVAALAMAAVVAVFVLAAARTPADPAIETPSDDVLATLQPVRTQTSAPRIAPGAAAADSDEANASATSTAELDVVAIGQAIETGDAVPITGGHTDLIRRYFGPFTVEAIVIVQCESGFDPSAVGTNTNGTQDHGLFQINDIHRRTFEVVTGRSWDHRYDPETNTAFAAWLFDHADGWGPWRCNRNLATFDEPVGD